MSRPNSIYHPLRGTEIRLLQIAPELRDGLLDCTIFHADLDLRPEFYALSYVWGDPNDTLPILVDGSRFQVTRNLHGALSRFRVLKDTEEEEGGNTINENDEGDRNAWWIDALCIRQDDEEEKSREVLRMGAIFGRATKVWVWLGLGDGKESVAARKLFHLGKRLDGDLRRIKREHSPDMGMDSLERSLKDKEYGTMGRLVSGQEGSFPSLLEAMKVILCHPWFTRIWTLQEAVLPEKFVALIFDTGKARANHAVLNRLVMFFDRAEDGEYGPVHDAQIRSDLGSMRTLEIRSDKLLCFRIVRQWQGLGRKKGGESNRGDSNAHAASLAKELHNYLGAISRRHATVSHDKIYGVLGLIEEAWCLPPLLKPDYKLDFRVVYHRFSRFVMEHTGYLDILHYTDPCVKDPDLPSWVPNLLRGPPSAKIPTASAPIPHPGMRGSTKFSPEGNVLIVQGRMFDTIPRDHLRHSVSSLSILPDNQMEVLQAWVGAFEKVFIPSAEFMGKAGMGEARMRHTAVWAFRMCAYSVNIERCLGVVNKNGLDELSELVGLIYDECRKGAKGEEPSSQSLEVILRNPLWGRHYQFLRELLGERMLGDCVLSATSKIVVPAFRPTGDAALAEGDVICELQGALMPLILRPMERRGHYTLVGSCDVFFWVGRKMDEKHFEGKELVTFHIH